MADLDHIPYMQGIVDADVKFITEREQTYRGSWKESGGRSAWFMLRRKMDRLINLLARPPEPSSFTPNLHLSNVKHLLAAYTSEDIFAKIREDPSGVDGSVLAEVRDLRRYLILVEAEMVCKGVIDGYEPRTADSV